jgi:hypothetical protein
MTCLAGIEIAQRHVPNVTNMKAIVVHNQHFTQSLARRSLIRMA